MKNKKKQTIYTFSIIAGLFVLAAASYTTWNKLDPGYTCALCHEVRPAHTLWERSAHASVTCTECHGTALESLASAKEKLHMITTHFKEKKTFEDIHLGEQQSLAIAARCAECHQAEHAAWQAGAHSATYKDIYMDEEHNRLERPYWDCLRCHGMFYDGDIGQLMNLDGSPAEWHLKDKKQEDLPTITCLACHQVHHEQEQNTPYHQLSEETRTTLAGKSKTPSTALYMRADKRHMPASMLLEITLASADTLNPAQTVADPNTLLCMQCHAPGNTKHLHSGDDMTPTGKFEGMSCITCHDPHSNRLKTTHKNVHKKQSGISMN